MTYREKINRMLVNCGARMLSLSIKKLGRHHQNVWTMLIEADVEMTISPPDYAENLRQALLNDGTETQEVHYELKDGYHFIRIITTAPATELIQPYYQVDPKKLTARYNEGYQQGVLNATAISAANERAMKADLSAKLVDFVIAHLDVDAFIELLCEKR